jgi:hypothetical protein
MVELLFVVQMLELIIEVRIVEMLFALLDARERATVRASFGFWIVARLNGAWLVHY